MLSKFLSNRIKRKQVRNEHQNIYHTTKNFEDNLIIRSKQLKINHCFIQKPDPNFFTIAESRNPKCGIIDCYSESD